MNDKTSNWPLDSPPVPAATGLASTTGTGDGLTITTGAGTAAGVAGVSSAQLVTLHTERPEPTEPAASTGATAVAFSHCHADAWNAPDEGAGAGVAACAADPNSTTARQAPAALATARQPQNLTAPNPTPGRARPAKSGQPRCRSRTAGSPPHTDHAEPPGSSDTTSASVVERRGLGKYRSRFHLRERLDGSRAAPLQRGRSACLGSSAGRAVRPRWPSPSPSQRGSRRQSGSPRPERPW